MRENNLIIFQNVKSPFTWLMCLFIYSATEKDINKDKHMNPIHHICSLFRLDRSYFIMWCWVVNVQKPVFGIYIAAGNRFTPLTIALFYHCRLDIQTNATRFRSLFLVSSLLLKYIHCRFRFPFLTSVPLV